MTKMAWVRVVMSFVAGLVVSFFWFGLWGIILMVILYPLVTIGGRKHV